MTQPPDPDAPPPTPDGQVPVPDLTPDPRATDDQPTVAWTPGAPSPGSTSPDPGAAAAGPSHEPPHPSDRPPSASPIISAAPPGGAAGASGAPFDPAVPATPATPGAAGFGSSGGQSPSAPPQPGDGSPVVGWAVPAPAVAVANADGFVLAGVGALAVAFLVDAFIVGLVPAVLGAVLNGTGGFGTIGPNGAITDAPPQRTVQTLLVELIGLGINFLYFVGLWTSGSRATLGQRLLAIEVADASSGQRLSLGAAVRRWIAFGAPLALLAYVPGLSGASGLLSLLLLVLILITTATDARRRGIQDKFAGSLVVRKATSGSGAILAGC